MTLLDTFVDFSEIRCACSSRSVCASQQLQCTTSNFHIRHAQSTVSVKQHHTCAKACVGWASEDMFQLFGHELHPRAVSIAVSTFALIALGTYEKLTHEGALLRPALSRRRHLFARNPFQRKTSVLGQPKPYAALQRVIVIVALVHVLCYAMRALHRLRMQPMLSTACRHQPHPLQRPKATSTSTCSRAATGVPSHVSTLLAPSLVMCPNWQRSASLEPFWEAPLAYSFAS